MIRKMLVGCALALSIAAHSNAAEDNVTTAPWTVEKAQAWYKKQPWLVGCNFSPSTAINQLEMWQADTFDLATIDRELGYAEKLGFTTVRVFLHDILWDTDREGFLKRIDQVLAAAEKHKIGVMLVLFDSVWDPFPKAGKQREPKPHVHNSGWVQSPGAEILKDSGKQDKLKDYVVGLISHFRNDKRVVIWDVYNEPDNPVPQYTKVELPNKKEAALQLLKKTFVWAREAKPSQPLTSGVWIGPWADPAKLNDTEKVQLENSDIVTFHTYDKLPDVQKCVENLARYNRPIVCTEYMARPRGSTFDPILGYFKEKNVGAYNWGFVDGKTQTIYPWDSWEKEYKQEPSPWFHDILRADGKPFNQEEVDYIKALTGKSKK